MYIMMQEGAHRSIEPLLERAAVRPRVRYRFSQVISILGIVQQGLGVSIAPRLALPSSTLVSCTVPSSRARPGASPRDARHHRAESGRPRLRRAGGAPGATPPRSAVTIDGNGSAGTEHPVLSRRGHRGLMPGVTRSAPSD
jgi:hypothetical protein